MRARNRLIVVLVLVAVLGASGCGGGQVSGDEVPGPPAVLTVPTDPDVGGATPTPTPTATPTPTPTG